MKLFVLLSFFAFSISASAQSLFFDNIKGSQWIIESYDDSLTFEEEKFGLMKFVGKDFAPPSFCMWTFNKKIEIRYYNQVSKKDSLIRMVRYEVVEEKNNKYIRIYPSDASNEYVEYEVGIISSGNFALFIKRKKTK